MTDNEIMASQIITSPCVGICQLDKEKVCIGCYRTSEEITYWRIYTKEERAQALTKIAERAEAANR